MDEYFIKPSSVLGWFFSMYALYRALVRRPILGRERPSWLILQGTITADKIAFGTITAASISSNAITTSDLAANYVR